MAEIKKRGGARPGAGRPRAKGKQTDAGRLTQSDAWFNAQIERDGRKIPRWKKFYSNLESLADGHFKAELNKETGEEKIFWISPDRAANQYLLDRHFGKPTEHTNVQGDLNSNLQLDDEQFTTLVKLASERIAGQDSGQ